MACTDIRVAVMNTSGIAKVNQRLACPNGGAGLGIRPTLSVPPSADREHQRRALIRRRAATIDDDDHPFATEFDSCPNYWGLRMSLASP